MMGRKKKERHAEVIIIKVIERHREGRLMTLALESRRNLEKAEFVLPLSGIKASQRALADGQSHGSISGMTQICNTQSTEAAE